MGVVARASQRIFFDQRDHALLQIVNGVLRKDSSEEADKYRFYPYFHPHGIKELAEYKGLRIAYAVVHLMGSIEGGEVDERLRALRSLRDEVLNATDGPMPVNTGRVLLELMKDMVRSRGNYSKQLRLARSFRMLTVGKPRIVRSLLKRYHLLEMPEAWNQIAFDDHVHDANTKGRKTSTRLIMDAWIKGIRRLRVIFYNYIHPRVASELIEAAEIMGITLRIGIEFSARFRGRFVQLIWVPRGFPDSQAFLCFLAEPSVMHLMAEGRRVSEYRQRHVMAAFAKFNQVHRESINREYNLEIPPLERDHFTAFVGTGQASLIHLGDYVHSILVDALMKRISALKAQKPARGSGEAEEIERLVHTVRNLDADAIVDQYLKPDKNPDLPDPEIPGNDPDTPQLLQKTPQELLHWLASLRTGYRVTLNLSNLQTEDVLELLYDCEGIITRLEIFNLKDYAARKTDHIPPIIELQQALNQRSVIGLKRVICRTIQRVKAADYEDKYDRIEKLDSILHDIDNFKSMYQATPLKSRIGSDSTGRSPRVHGMGLALRETLPRRAQKQIENSTGPSRLTIPIRMTAYRRITFIPRTGGGPVARCLDRTLGRIPGVKSLFDRRQKDWEVREHATQLTPQGNIITLGGVQAANQLNLETLSPKLAQKSPPRSWKYLNTYLKNFLKVLIGFFPAFATFALTKDWWFLAYCGAFVWFGITGLRNILQSVLGGGGLSRSPLLRWNEYVSWERITDSLLFTGFSVPLLDYVIKTLLLDRAFGVTTATSPIALYTVMAVANGIYLMSHNLLRGLPKGAVFGNFFRSLLAIPLAVAFNSAIGGMMAMAGAVNIEATLQKWAAVISKAASDCVAGVIEGTADRFKNVGARSREYTAKILQLFDAYAQLEILFPELDVLDMLENPKKYVHMRHAEARDLEKVIIIGALDLLYFWHYQPRARTALRAMMKAYSPEERQIFVRVQSVLTRQREISQLFIDGIIGANFSRALSFYLNFAEDYLKVIRKMAGRPPEPCRAADLEN